MTRKFYPGQIVELHVRTTHEGPHPDDQFNETRYAIVVHVHRHPYNKTITESYDVVEFEQTPYNEIGVEPLNVRSIARLARDVPVIADLQLRSAYRNALATPITFRRERPVVF